LLAVYVIINNKKGHVGKLVLRVFWTGVRIPRGPPQLFIP
jgi:hypothetical protein